MADLDGSSTYSWDRDNDGKPLGSRARRKRLAEITATRDEAHHNRGGIVDGPLTTELLRYDVWTPQGDEAVVWKFTLTEGTAIRMEREQRDMIEDAFWLIEQALAQRTEGPLTFPRLKVPVR